MPRATLNDIQLHYQTHGSGPAVVLLHGLGSSSADWALQVPVLSNRWQVITPDLRAHGASTGVETRFTVETMADDVAALLDRLGVERAHVVGLSLGGCVTLALGLNHPGRVRSLTLVNTFARYRPPGLGGLLRALRRLWLLRFGSMTQVAEFVAAGLFPKPEQRLLYEAAVASLSRNSRQTYFAAISAINRFDMRTRLGQLGLPVLIIAGDRDRTVPSACQQELQRLIPAAHLQIIPDSGHATPYDQSEEFNRVVETFLAGQAAAVAG